MLRATDRNTDKETDRATRLVSEAVELIARSGEQATGTRVKDIVADKRAGL